MTISGVQIIGLTGGMGAGKSTVGKMFQMLGATVIDADELARRVVRPGSEVLAAIVERFGAEVLSPDGALNRAHLAEQVFSDECARQALERITHPAIGEAFHAEVRRLAQLGIEAVVYEAALLIEAERHHDMDVLIVVIADDRLRLARICRRDGLDLAAAKHRLAAQLPQQMKADLANFVIDNSGTLDETQKQVVATWSVICPKP